MNVNFNILNKIIDELDLKLKFIEFYFFMNLYIKF